MKDFLLSTMRGAGEMAKEYFCRGVISSTKSNLADLVTQADIAVSDFFVKKISEKFPSHHIHTEEMHEDINAGAEYEWVIDPIDGTRNFSLGIPIWCILAAVLHKGETTLGAAYLPVSNQLFFAERGSGSWLNNQRLPLFETKADLQFTPGQVNVRMDKPLSQKYLSALNKYFLAGGRPGYFHNMSGACFVATGGLQVFATNSGRDHDYLAPALICAEAGMVGTDVEGKPWKRGRQDIVIANPKLHPKVLELFV